MDTVFFYGVFKEYFLFVGKGELLNWPLFGLFFRKMDIPVQRQNLRLAYNALIKAYEAIDAGHNIAIYPEGTVPMDSPKMGNFKNGAFKMAIEKQVPIVPVTWQSNFLIMRDPSLVWEPSLPRISKVVVHPTISTKGMTLEDLPELRKRVFQTIDGAIPDGHRSSIIALERE
jgi:1-acyl-sn-glycerol-3-phosphate acyltransferase